jgi:hypothetical protein
VGHTSLDVYLNDHLAGSTMGRDLAGQIQSQTDGTPLGDVMAAIAAEIDEDRATLEALMERLGTTANPIKQSITWLTEKVARLKFSGATMRDRDLGTFLALETLSLGVEGKRALWEALATAGGVPALDDLDLQELIRRAERQRATIERERLALAPRALADDED